MKLTDLGKVGRLEAARQALEEAGPHGLIGREIMEAAGLYRVGASGGNIQHFLCQLTTYCFIYESDTGRRYYLDVERDATFDRRIFEDTIFTDEEDI